MDVIPVQHWIWKAVMAVQFHGTFVSSFSLLSAPLVFWWTVLACLAHEALRREGHKTKTKKKRDETDKI